MNTLSSSRPGTRVSRTILASLAVAPLLAGTVLHGAILPVVSSVASSVFQVNDPVRTINGSGMTGSMTTESELLLATHDNNGGATTMWHSAVLTGNNAAGQWLVWNLSAPSNLRSIYYWNHNQSGLTNRGIQQVEIQVSKDNGATYTTVTTTNLIAASGSATERPHTLELSSLQTAVTNVRFNILSNFGGNVVGLSEIRFSDTTVPSIPPVLSFNAFPRILRNGASVLLGWNSDAESATLNPGNIAATPVTAGSRTLVPPQNADTVYTLTANKGTASVSSSVTVRSVAGGTSNYRYVRFTPVKYRGAGNSVQVGEFWFYNDAAGTVPVVPVSAENPAGSNPADQGPLQAIDGDPATKWLDYNKSPIVFDFGETHQSFTSYAFTAAGDAPERDPVQWFMEGSNDQVSWTLIENVTAFDFSFPAARGFKSDIVPLPGTSLIPLVPSIQFFAAQREVISPDLPMTLRWQVQGAVKVTIKVNGGAEINVTDDVGSYRDFPAVTVPTVYTLTAYSPSNNTSTSTVSVKPPVTPVPASINYADFSAVGTDIVGNGSTVAINYKVQIPTGGDQLRLRLKGDYAGQIGSAWFHDKVAVSGGFDTSFPLQLATKDRQFGAYGLSFVVQNTPDGTASLPGVTGPETNALTVEFSSWNDNAPNEVPADTLWEAQVRIFQGIGGTVTPIGNVNLRNTPLYNLLRNQDDHTLTSRYADTPYQVRITYSAAGLLDVYMDGVHVVDSFPVALGDAADAQGKAYVGFVATTGGNYQNSDITRWTLTSGFTGGTANPLAITAYTINPVSGALSLTWGSNAGESYRVTASPNLATWTTVLKSGVAATGASTTTTTTFTPGAVRFFRVEKE